MIRKEIKLIAFINSWIKGKFVFVGNICGSKNIATQSILNWETNSSQIFKLKCKFFVLKVELLPIGKIFYYSVSNRLVSDLKASEKSYRWEITWELKWPYCCVLKTNKVSSYPHAGPSSPQRQYLWNTGPASKAPNFRLKSVIFKELNKFNC